MVAKGTKRVGNYPAAKYHYKPGDSKHPYEMRACLACGEDALMRRDQGEFCSVKCAQSGGNNSVWKGDNAGYVSLHARVYRTRGKAAAFMCACGKQARDWANQTGSYADVDDYIAMCSKCHRALDAL